MIRKDLGILLIIVGTLFGVISYGALAVTHYDVDPISVLASALNLPIPTLGYICGGLGLLSLISGGVLCFFPSN